MKRIDNLRKLIFGALLCVMALFVAINPHMTAQASSDKQQEHDTGSQEELIYDYNSNAYDSYEEAIEASRQAVSDSPNTITDLPEIVNGNTVYLTAEAAGDAYREAMVYRLPSVEITYVNTEEWNELYDYYYALGYREYDDTKDLDKAIAVDMYYTIRDEAIKHTGVYTEGDYLWWNFAGARVSYSRIKDGFVFEVSLTYLSTYEQEKVIDAEVERLLNNEFYGWENLPDVERVRMVYKWMTSTYSYEQSVDNHSTYSGIINHETVCQGFATSMYRLLGEMGVDTRVVANEGHGWNIVKLGKYWYNLDATWDAGKSEENWRYFLPDNDDFTYAGNHIRGEKYDTQEFHADHPMAPGEFDYEASRDTIGVSYRTHVQSYGWQDMAYDGMISGTSGQSKRLEGIEIKLSNKSGYDIGVEYRTHIQSYGWEKTWKKDGAMSGTQGESKRLEAIQIRLTGADSDSFDIYYRVHAQNYGWLGWAKNGEQAGTAGQSKRLEAIQILLLPKGEMPVGLLGYSYIDYGLSSESEDDGQGLVNYRTHVQNYGWQGYVYDGSISGTSGLSKRLEGINISLGNTGYEGGIRYTTHVQSYGWQQDKDNPESWSKDGELSGTQGESKRLEGIRIELYGDVALHYDVYYRVHAQTYGWLDWAANGADAGTAGLSKRLEAIQIVILPKGSDAPGSTARPFITP